MTVSLCIAGLGVIIITSWYSFMWHIATMCEQKRRLDHQMETIHAATPFDNDDRFFDSRDNHDVA